MGCMPSKRRRIGTNGPNPVVCIVNRHRLAGSPDCEEVLRLAFPEGHAMAVLFHVVLLHAVVILERRPQKVRVLELDAKDWLSWWKRSCRMRGGERGTRVLIVPPGAADEVKTSRSRYRVVIAAGSWEELLRQMWMLECPAETPQHAALLVKVGQCRLPDGVAIGQDTTCDPRGGRAPWAELTLDLVFQLSCVGRKGRREADGQLRKVGSDGDTRRLLAESLEECVLRPRLELKLVSQGSHLTTVTAVLHANGAAVVGSRGETRDLGWGQDVLSVSLGCSSSPSALTLLKQEAGQLGDASGAQFHVKRLGLNNEVRFVGMHFPPSDTEDGAGKSTGLDQDEGMTVEATWNVNFHHCVPYEYKFSVSRKLLVLSHVREKVTLDQIWSRGLTMYHQTSKFWGRSWSPQQDESCQ